MGGSASTRKITVVNEDTVNVIKVSESVVNRLKQGNTESKPVSQHAAGAPSSYPADGPRIFDSLQFRQQKEEDIKVLEKTWQDQLDELQRQNQELYNVVTGKMTASLTALEEKAMQRNCSPVCEEHKQKVFNCYQQNAKTSLNCSKEVLDFVKCVDMKRMVIAFDFPT